MPPGAWPPGKGEMAQRIRAHDWTTTPLGPVEGWPQSLRTAVDMVLAMPGPASILWGPTHAQLYNDAYIAIARSRHPAMLGRPAAENWPDVYVEMLAPVMEAALAGHATRFTDFSVTLQGPDGQLAERAFDSTWSPIPDEVGVATGALEILVEVTDRRRAEASLRESKARHRLLIESWAQAIWETDANGVVVADSPSWRVYTGQTLEEWLGYGWVDAIHPDDRAYAERQWREAIAARGLVDAEFRLRAPDGGWRWTNVRAAPVLDAGGKIEKWAGMNIDIDVRKRAETALRESEERQAFLLKLSDALRPLADPVAIQEAASRMTAEHLDIGRVAYCEIRYEPNIVALVERDWLRRGMPSIAAGRYRMDDFGPFLADELTAGRPAIVADAATDPRLTQAERDQ
jgi:PAS domain S-box-containing protein